MKKIYKIIASISVFLLVLFFGVVLVVGNSSKKANAGVIIEEKYLIDNNSYNVYLNSVSANNLKKAIQIDNLQYLGIEYNPNLNSGFAYIFNDQRQNENQAINVNTRLYTLTIYGYDGTTANTSRVIIQFARYSSSSANISNTYFACELKTINNVVYLIIDFTNLKQTLNTNNATIVLPTSSTAHCDFFTKSATISACTNIYDLENKSFCLLYLSDISGIATEQMRDEITINWGFIDSTDNELYAEYAPTISAQNLLVDDDTVIRIGIPLNNSGSAMDYYDISQRAILSTIAPANGGALAQAHIYGIYVWRSLNMIEWGLAEFDTTSMPASGQSMNYLTSTTRLYQYQNTGTFTMTCRLSVSSNFNFITIKNQEQVDVSSVNAVIRRGGFMPAWAVYNWARGSQIGFSSGEQYATAQYQPGQPGYQEIYQAGRAAGIAENIGSQSWFMTIFQGVDSFLNIRIFPNITFGVLLGTPFVISVVWFIIRSFRGGGGN